MNDASFPTWWFHPGLLLAGPYPGSVDEQDARSKLRRLLGRGIRSFVDLTREGEYTGRGNLLLPYAGLLAEEAKRAGVRAEHRRFGIEDLWVPTAERMTEILDYLERCVALRERAYVHCLGGRGRTGTVVACWLVREAWAKGERITGLEALNRLRALRESQGVPDPWDCPQMSVQFEFVRAWGGEGEHGHER